MKIKIYLFFKKLQSQTFNESFFSLPEQEMIDIQDIFANMDGVYSDEISGGHQKNLDKLRFLNFLVSIQQTMYNLIYVINVFRRKIQQN